jgi:hypothetical protein
VCDAGSGDMYRGHLLAEQGDSRSDVARRGHVQALLTHAYAERRTSL